MILQDSREKLDEGSSLRVIFRVNPLALFAAECVHVFFVSSFHASVRARARVNKMAVRINITARFVFRVTIIIY